jgi:hypothetical protein
VKRSDMLVLIANQLDFLNGKFVGSRMKQSFTTDELGKADVVLTTIEQCGMLPPFSDKLFQAACRSSKAPSSNSWEPEND